MTLNNIDTDEALANIKKLMKEEDLSPALKASIEVIILLVTLLVNRLGLNSRNSSRPPSSDFGQNEKSGEDKKDDKKGNGKGRKPGGQPGRKGKTLKPVDHPDEVVSLEIDRRTLPRDGQYTSAGFETRQVFNIKISSHVIEYQAEVLVDQKGQRFTAPFPDGVDQKTQYGNDVKAHSVYLSQFQLIPYNRLSDYFSSIMGLPVSEGSLYNFNLQVYQLLERVEDYTKLQLIDEAMLHADETGIKVGGRKVWLHCVSSPLWTYLYPHKSRGSDAMQEMDVLSHFEGILCHDHWKAYFTYICLHALCNAHHLRELERAYEQDGQRWAKNMKNLLLEMNQLTKENEGALTEDQAKPLIKRYRSLLTQGSKECPENISIAGKRGRTAQSKSRNLLNRLREYETEALRFLTDADVPFTNNQGENDIRMSKVHQKISGCFRSMMGAKIFCRVRGFLITCRKHGVNPADALTGLFAGELPDFIKITDSG
jgi:transposase